MSNNLSIYVPHISKTNFNSEASAILRETFPDALVKPMAVPTEKIATEKLGLKILEVRLTEDLSILGQMCFTSGRVEIYDKKEDEYREIVVDAGTMIIDPDVIAQRGIGAKRNTIAHECVHWKKHRLYHLHATHEDINGVAHRCPSVPKSELFQTKWNDEDWMEWQANGIAPRILMPIETVPSVYEIMRKKSLQNPFVAKGLRPQSEWIIEQFAGFYRVSRESATIRLQELGYLS